MLEGIQKLIHTLDAAGIAFCHWKSNFALDRALEGFDDVDLLVDKAKASLFEACILGLGFKRALSQGSSPHPGVEHFFGPDEASGQLVHLHIYYQILSGENLHKNYHLPFEDQLLQNLIRDKGMPIPSRRIELEFLVMRVMIKFGSLAEQVLFAKEKKSIREEIKFLLAHQPPHAETPLILGEVAGLSPAFFQSCVEALDRGSALRWYVLGRKMRRLLKGYRRHSTLQEISLKAAEFLLRIRSRIGPRKRKVPAHGGMVIAVTGADATGKSTLSSRLREWLGGAYTVRRIHAGKPPSGILSFIPNLGLPLLRRVFKSSRTSVGIKPEEGISGGGLLSAIRLILLARDRRRLLRKAFGWATDGAIVICDRYPSLTFGAMDSPRIRTGGRRFGASLVERLAQAEKRIYENMPKADVLLKLTIDVEIAVQRNRDRIKAGNESEEYIRTRHRENADLRFLYKRIYPVSTNGPIEDVLREIKTVIWKNL